MRVRRPAIVRAITRHLAAYLVGYLVAYPDYSCGVLAQAPKIVSMGLFIADGPRFNTWV